MPVASIRLGCVGAVGQFRYHRIFRRRQVDYSRGRSENSRRDLERFGEGEATVHLVGVGAMTVVRRLTTVAAVVFRRR